MAIQPCAAPRGTGAGSALRRRWRCGRGGARPLLVDPPSLALDASLRGVLPADNDAPEVPVAVPSPRTSPDSDIERGVPPLDWSPPFAEALVASVRAASLAPFVLSPSPSSPCGVCSPDVCPPVASPPLSVTSPAPAGYRALPCDERPADAGMPPVDSANEADVGTSAGDRAPEGGGVDTRGRVSPPRCELRVVGVDAAVEREAGVDNESEGSSPTDAPLAAATPAEKGDGDAESGVAVAPPPDEGDDAETEREGEEDIDPALPPPRAQVGGSTGRRVFGCGPSGGVPARLARARRGGGNRPGDSSATADGVAPEEGVVPPALAGDTSDGVPAGLRMSEGRIRPMTSLPPSSGSAAAVASGRGCGAASGGVPTPGLRVDNEVASVPKVVARPAALLPPVLVGSGGALALLGVAPSEAGVADTGDVNDEGCDAGVGAGGGGGGAPRRTGTAALLGNNGGPRRSRASAAKSSERPASAAAAATERDDGDSVGGEVGRPRGTDSRGWGGEMAAGCSMLDTRCERLRTGAELWRLWNSALLTRGGGWVTGSILWRERRLVGDLSILSWALRRREGGGARLRRRS